ncbi:MAG: winged helix-turn-helix transcriptional regulator [Elusimicrobia bacterium]|nr:winged helix-turn-helix transcriptional regulator [Elusimicrobiota bacterium]
MNTQPPNQLLEREFNLIQAIEQRPDITQRELSESVGCSLGMTNILLKRLVKKGFLKIGQLDWNKTRYLLTYEGSLEKARKSYAYAIHTWRQARLIIQAIQQKIITEYETGARHAAVVAWPETAAVIQGALAEKDLPGLTIEYVEAYKYLKPEHTLVFAATVEPTPEPADGRRVVPLLEKVDLQFKFES